MLLRAMPRPWHTSAVLATAMSVLGCPSDRPNTHGRPVWESASAQARAHRSPAPRPSGSARAPDLPRIAPPLRPTEQLPPPCSVSDRIPKLSPNEQVLVAPLRVSFLTATVARVKPGGKVVVRSRHDNEFEAAAEHVYAIRPLHRSIAQEGCYGACRKAGAWTPCRVKQAERQRLVVSDHDGREWRVDRAQMLVFDPSVQERVREFFVRTAHERQFRDVVANAGSPALRSQGDCSKGRVVLGRFGDSYRMAEILAPSTDGCSVRWLASTLGPSTRAKTDLLDWPRPSNTARLPDPGEIVLAREGSSTKREDLAIDEAAREPSQAKLPAQVWTEWAAARVQAVYPDGRLQLTGANGETRPDRAENVVPFTRRSSAERPTRQKER